MKNLIAVLMLIASCLSHGQDLPFNELKFSNRAQCAIDSTLPTTSFFLVLDSYNAGRASFGMAKNLGLNADEWASTGMKEFRLTLAGLQLQIIDKLLAGQLPLLPHDLAPGISTNLKKYRSLARNCGENIFCEPLRKYLAKIWQESRTTSETERLQNLQSLDGIKNQDFVKPQAIRSASCLYLKRFSPLQGPLQTTGIDAAQLSALAQTVLNSTEFMTSCQDQDNKLDSRNVALQFDLQIKDNKYWNSIGYDFWNSVKIYLSWAWRYAPELKDWSPQLQSVFRSLDLEESIIFMPNGCRSFTEPKCDNQTLVVNALRELAKKTGTTSEFDDPVAKGPETNLKDRGARSVNNDFLATTSYDKASEWIANFRKNFVETRWIMKNKVFNANQNMTVIARNFSPTDLANSILDIVRSNDKIRDEAAYLCLEWRLSSDKKLDFLRTDIDRIVQLSTMAQMNTQVGLSIADQIKYFQELSQALRPVCEGLEQSDYFRAADYQTNWFGLELWAKDLIKSSLPETNSPIPFQPYIPATGAFLTLGTDHSTFCANPLDCARKIFKSAVDLYTASTYAEAFLPVTSTPISADIFNPYAELKTCKVYDPWFVQNRVRKIFLADLLNTALVGWNPIPVYLDVNFTEPTVTSFNKLLKDGKIKFDPNVKRSTLSGALLADFGPLLGAPCAVQVSPDANHSFNFYAFNGISLNYCHAKANHDGVVDRPSDVKVSDPKDPSFCAGCTLNFVGVSSAVSSDLRSSPFNPLKFAVYLFRAVYRFVVGMRDKVNIPQSYVVKIDRVVEAYKRYGDHIPNFCVEPLSLGYSCFQNICASKLGDFFLSHYGAKASTVNWRDRDSAEHLRKQGTLKIQECSGEISVEFTCREPSGKNWSINSASISATGSCKKWIEALR